MPTPQKDGSTRWTVAEMWPAHADHDVRYQRDISESFRLRTMDTEVGFDGYPSITFVQFDEIAVSSGVGDSRSDEYWCATCGEELYEHHLWEPKEAPDGDRT